MFTDYVLNGQGHGPIGQTIGEVRFAPELLRPYLNERGQRVVTVNTGRTRQVTHVNEITKQKERVTVPVYKPMLVSEAIQRGINIPVANASSLQKLAWVEFDKAVVRATRQRLRAWTDLVNSSSRGGFNAMGRLTLEYQAMSDPGEALKDMDALSEGRNDRPLFNLKSVPLPITHSDFWISERELAISRNTSTPLDTTLAEAAGRRVAELIEKTLIGTETGITYGTISTGPYPHTGTSTEYGYTNFPYRVTKTDLHTPTSANPENVIEDILEMRETMRTNGFFGPYMVYHSTGYDRFLDDDYFRTGGTSVTRTLRERVASIEGIQDMRRLDYLTSGYQLIMVQMTSEVAQAINGMSITTVQWPSQGGMRTNFKVMAIQVPLLKSPYNGIGGILHGTTS